MGGLQLVIISRSLSSGRVGTKENKGREKEEEKRRGEEMSHRILSTGGAWVHMKPLLLLCVCVCVLMNPRWAHRRPSMQRESEAGVVWPKIGEDRQTHTHK